MNKNLQNKKQVLHKFYIDDKLLLSFGLTFGELEDDGLESSVSFIIYLNI
jgi:hypothetical protein